MALRGRGVAQQNRGSSGEGIWIIKPIDGNIWQLYDGDRGRRGHALRGGHVERLKLAYYTAKEFVTGFKKRLVFQLHGIKKNGGSSGEAIWITKRQPGNFARRDGTYGLNGRAVQGGHFEHRFGGHARTLHRRRVCGWLQENNGFPATRQQAEQRLVRRRHLDHQIRQLMHFTRRGGVHGHEGHAVQGGNVEHRFGGHTRVRHRRGVCVWLQDLEEDVGLPAVRHQAERRLVRRGRLDCQTETWQPPQVLRIRVMHRRRGVR